MRREGFVFWLKCCLMLHCTSAGKEWSNEREALEDSGWIIFPNICEQKRVPDEEYINHIYTQKNIQCLPIINISLWKFTL
jgi:hypothetical protein